MSPQTKKKVKLSSLARPADSKEGVWIDAAGLQGVRFRVRPASAPEYRAAMINLAAAQSRGTVSAEDVVRNDIEDGAALADHILTGWEGFDEPYSADTAKTRLTDPQFGDLRGYVATAARKAAEAHVEFVEALEGN